MRIRLPRDSKSKSSKLKLFTANRRGFVLIMVLLVVAAVTLAALGFSEAMLSSREESILLNRATQARMAAESGVDHIRLFLSKPPADQVNAGGVWNNPGFFQAINIVPETDLNKVANFSIMASGLDANDSCLEFGTVCRTNLRS